jgi:hypothetical protein
MNAWETVAAVAATILSFGEAHAKDVSFDARLSCGDGRCDPRSPGGHLHETRLDREQLIEVIACGRLTRPKSGPKLSCFSASSRISAKGLAISARWRVATDRRSPQYRGRGNQKVMLLD